MSDTVSNTVSNTSSISTSISIAQERPDHPDATLLIEELEALLSPLYPDESRHGYSVQKLMDQNVHFFVVRCGDRAAACGGIQFFTDDAPAYGELKRMFVRPAFRGRGLAKHLLQHFEAVAAAHQIRTLRLETGIHQTEAIGLYERSGYRRIGPFGAYRPDPNSIFYEKKVP